MKELRRDVANIYHKTIGVGIARMRAYEYAGVLKGLEPGTYLRGEEPPGYCGQLGSAETDKISEFYGYIDDVAAAKRFGTTDLSEFSYWSWRSCGICAVQMAIAEFKDDFNETTMQLVKKVLDKGGYMFEGDVGWYHAKLAELVETYGLKAKIEKFVPFEKIADEIIAGSLVVASLESETTGHLILVYGFNLNDNSELAGFWVHDPNEYISDGQEKYILKGDFANKFTRRIIIISKNE